MASRLYIQAGFVHEAAKCLERMGNFEGAVLVLVGKRLLEEAYHVAKRYEETTSSHLQHPQYSAENLAYKAALLFAENGDKKGLPRMLKVLPKSRRVEPLLRAGELEKAVAVLDSLGKVIEAAEVYLKAGMLLKAADHVKDVQSPAANRLRANCLLIETELRCSVEGNSAIVRSELAKRLEEVLRLFRAERPKNEEDFYCYGEAQALLALGSLERSPKHLMNAARKFAAYGHSAGEAEVVVQLSQLLQSKGLSADQVHRMIPATELGSTTGRLLRLSKSFLSPFIPFDELEIKSSLDFYGLEYVGGRLRANQQNSRISRPGRRDCGDVQTEDTRWHFQQSHQPP